MKWNPEARPPERRAAGATEARLRVLLELLREETGSDLVYLGRFMDGKQHLRLIAGSHPGLRLLEGATSPLEVTYCWRVPQGIIPRSIPDSAADPRVSGLPGHLQEGIGSYVASPVYMPDGKVYGTVCSLTHEPAGAIEPAREERVRVLASLISASLPRFEAERVGFAEGREQIAAFLGGRGLRTVFQPIVDMATGEVAGYETLSRFSSLPEHSPEWWIQLAEGVELGDELEMAMFRSALSALLEAGLERPVTVNASPGLMSAPGFLAELDRVRGRRVVIELTERAMISDYAALQPVLAELHARGLLVAVDDAGAGFAGFRHLLEMHPDVIKLDISLTRDVDSDPARQALAQALLTFGDRIKVPIVVEGIETAAERTALLALGYRYGQGYLFARPASMEDARSYDGAAVLARL